MSNPEKAFPKPSGTAGPSGSTRRACEAVLAAL